jgi:acetyltransferase-like isoleucine patch superfamily enzyme
MNSILIRVSSYFIFFRQFIRQRYYKFVLSCPKSVIFLGKIKFGDPKKISIGADVRLNDGVFLNIGKSLMIEDNVTISANVFITDTTIDIKLLPKQVHLRDSIIIKKNVWIGAGAIILPGVTIGEAGCYHR